MIKRLIIKWSNRQLVKMINEVKNWDYGKMGYYGIADILLNEHTREPMIVLDGIKPNK